jgi:Peptidase family C25
LERRASQGLLVKGVSFEEIVSEFGHGEPSGEAIREFVSWAYHEWSRPSVRYVLVVGDSSFDPRNFRGTSWGVPLPALWTATSYMWTASDPLLGAVNGEDDLPDVAVGRLAARSVAEAQGLVEKILAWEDSGQTLGGAAALVADNPDAAGNFEADTVDIAESYLSGRSPEVLFVSELGGAGTRGAILDALDGGLGLLSYVGHGGTAVWADEQVLGVSDVASLQEQAQQPLVVAMNCLSGYFVAPNGESLSEALVKAGGRGAIAAFSPTGLSLDGPAHEYQRAVMKEITSGRYQRLGDAILAAQRDYALSGAFPELLEIYSLLGDPALTIR